MSLRREEALPLLPDALAEAQRYVQSIAQAKAEQAEGRASAVRACRLPADAAQMFVRLFADELKAVQVFLELMDEHGPDTMRKRLTEAQSAAVAHEQFWGRR